MATVVLQSCDNVELLVDHELVGLSPTLDHLIRQDVPQFLNCCGGSVFLVRRRHVIVQNEDRIVANLVRQSDETAVVALPEMTADTLEIVIRHCAFLLKEGPEAMSQLAAADPPSFLFDKKRCSQTVVCEVAAAAYYLDIAALVDLTSQALVDILAMPKGVSLFSTIGLGEVAVSAGPPPIVAARAVETASASVASKTEEAGVAERAARGGYVPDDRPLDELLEYIDGGDSSKKKKKRKRRKGKARLSEDDGDAGAIPMSDPRLAENDGGGPATSELSADAHEEAEQQTHAEEEAAVVPEAAEVAAAAPGVLDAKGDAPLQSPGLRPAAAAVPRSTAHAQASLGGDGRFARVQPNPSVAMDLAQQLAAPLEERRRLAQEKLQRLCLDDIEWANEDDDPEDAELDTELEDFRRRLAAMDVPRTQPAQ